jgi:hypothetical protein
MPWYFITLALMGAAISISRKVPEYQRRVYYPHPKANPGAAGAPADDSAKAQDDEGRPLKPGEVREYLIFQILQFLSAPFIAIVAYYAIKPGSAAESVGLGFISGFSSPAVLVLINAAMERVSGLETKKAVEAQRKPEPPTTPPNGSAANS